MPKSIESIDATIATTPAPSRVIVHRRPPNGIDVVRVDDLLVLSFDFTNFELNNAQFIRANESDPALMMITFQPQSFAESAFTVSEDGTVDTHTTPFECAMANKSQIAFTIPASVSAIPLANLLDWTQYQLKVASGELDAGPDGGPGDQTVTLIEAPYGLILTPYASATWSHSNLPVQRNGVTELWHSILKANMLAAIFARAQFPVGALDDRVALKNQSSQALQTGKDAIQSRRFMLSSLGAFFDLYGKWEWDPPAPLLEWEHRATMGRDQYVRQVANGYLYPFGHRACKVSVTERRLIAWNQKNPPPDDGTLYLLTRTYLVVRDRVKSYDVPQIPFRKVECLTRVTPDLDPDKSNPGCLKVNTKNFLFHFVGTDVHSRSTSFTSPVIFVDLTQPVVTENVTSAFTNDGGESNLSGQPVAYGDESANTVLHTLAMKFAGDFTGAGDNQSVTPSMVDAHVRVPALTHLLGSDQPRRIGLTKPTTQKAQDLSIFAKFLDEPIDFKFSSKDQSGGLLQPDMALRSLSHTYGPIVGSPDEYTDDFNPATFFSHIMLLGCIPLSDIIHSGAVLPKILVEPAAPTGSTTTKMSWSPGLTSSGRFIANKNFPPDPNTAATLSLNITKTIGPPEAATPDATMASCTLSNFQLNLFGIITIAFDSLEFEQRTGQKPAITAKVYSVNFGKPLNFLNDLRSFIPSDGFSNPPALEITPQGAQLGYSLALPPIAVGAFALQNVDLGASLQIPFQGDPVALFFHFATPEKPFLLTVDGICGGGYFNIDVTAKGVQSLNVALEFGGNLSLDLGVASGGVTITGGFHFGYHLEDTTQQVVDLTAFVQASGYMEVLGLVTVSTEFYVGLTYEKNGTTPEFSGTATMTVAVDVLFFHDSVELSMTESFQAHGADPKFTDQISQGEWNYYCDCFAVAA